MPFEVAGEGVQVDLTTERIGTRPEDRVVVASLGHEVVHRYAIGQFHGRIRPDPRKQHGPEPSVVRLNGQTQDQKVSRLSGVMTWAK